MDIGLLSTIFRFILFLVQVYYIGMIVYFFTLGFLVSENLKLENFREDL